MKFTAQTAKLLNDAIDNVYTNNNLWGVVANSNMEGFSAEALNVLVNRLNVSVNDLALLPTQYNEYDDFDSWYYSMLPEIEDAEIEVMNNLYVCLENDYEKALNGKSFCDHDMEKILKKHNLNPAEYKNTSCESLFEYCFDAIKLSNGHILVKYDETGMFNSEERRNIIEAVTEEFINNITKLFDRLNSKYTNWFAI